MVYKNHNKKLSKNADLKDKIKKARYCSSFSFPLLPVWQLNI